MIYDKQGAQPARNLVFVVPKRLEATNLEYITRDSVEQKPVTVRARRMKKKTTAPLTSILTRSIPNRERVKSCQIKWVLGPQANLH